MEEIKRKVARIFEVHLPDEDTSELNSNFVTDDRAGIDRLLEIIDGFVLGRLKNWYVDEGTEHPWIIKVIRLLRGFCTQWKASSTSYQTVYDEFLKVRAECWKIIHEE